MENQKSVKKIFEREITFVDKLILFSDQTDFKNQEQTNNTFSEKWKVLDENNSSEEYGFESFQRKWFLELYGFSSENDLKEFLKGKIIIDAGCGLGYKSNWFANLASDSLVIGIDYSNSVKIASEKYKKVDNLFFVQGDIADTRIKLNSIDLVICDQVIMHTEKPKKTFNHLSSLLAPMGEFCCYVYAKKALPRELLDDYFRNETHKLTKDQVWELSEQLTELGKRLTDLQVKFNSPEIPLLGIKGGEYDIQRFIYWNFMKCFYNEDLGYETSIAGNFDWYAPSNARRFDESEFKKMIYENNLEIVHFHSEEACYSGRFKNS